MWRAAVAPAVLAFAAATALRPVLLRRRIARLRIDNYRGRTVWVVGGVVVAGALAATEIALRAADAFGGDGDWLPSLTSRTHLGLLLLALGFFALGFLDDYAGDGRSKGFAGHLGALRRGEVTTGAVKAFGGLGLAFAVSLWWESWSLPPAVLDALVIALAANFVNLLDLRPGRAAKAFLVLWIPAALAARNSGYLPLSAAAAGASLAWLPADLGERGTLGDAGANLLGGVVGAGVVAAAGVPGRLAVLAVLVGLTLASERVSFTKVIERTGPLRWLDGLGRRPGG